MSSGKPGTWLRASGKPQVFLAAFGKHPAWDDHIEDQGLETDRLVLLRRLLYVEGVSGNVESGAWERLGPGGELPGFGHVFVWRLGDDVFVGRLWSSRDGKGRDRYPLVAVFHARGVGLGWAMGELPGRLEAVERACVSAGTQSELAEVLRAQRESARAALGSAAEGALAEPLRPDLAGLACAPELGPDRLGLTRMQYAAFRELEPWQAEHEGFGSKLLRSEGRHLRAPVALGDAMSAWRAWTGFALGRVGPGSPVMTLMPVGGGWVDLVFGEPGRSVLVCLRAGLEAMPPTSRVPYTIDAAFAARAKEEADGWVREASAGLSEKPAGGEKGKSKWARWLGSGWMWTP